MTADFKARPVLPQGPSGPVPLLQTKLNIPRTGSALVPRARLTDSLIAGVGGRLTLLSAPAGYGKTTLLTQWLAAAPGIEGRAAWVSLDASENDPTLFWSYVVAAIQRVHPGTGREVLQLLGHDRVGSLRAVITELLNETAALDAETVLILDDYHVIETDAIHDQLAFMIDHLPHCMHVVVASRSDPPLPLARLRARGQLAELRVPDLRFSRDEASAFLNGVMSLDLAESDFMEIDSRTEGWITALKLTALARGAASAEGWRFRGGNGFIADYVLDEILRGEPEPVRQFLLATCTLKRLNAHVCAEVAQQPEAGRFLLDLARRDLFIVALDNEDGWFRYHQLFSEALRSHARKIDPELLRTSHRRASRWYEENGSRLEAMDHAHDAGDEQRVAELLEAEWPEKNQSHHSLGWLRRAKTLKDAAFADRPILSMGYAWALLNNGEPEAAEIPLRRVEAWLASTGPDVAASDPGSGGFVPRHRHQFLSAEHSAARAYLAQMLGDASGTIAHARTALDLTPDSDHAARATGTALVALAAWGSGRLEDAYETFDAALASMRRAARLHDAVRGTFVLGDLRVAQGRLREAAAIYEDGLRQAAEYEDAATVRSREAVAQSVEADELYLGLAEVHCEWDDLDAAERVLDRLQNARATAKHVGKPQRWLVTTARIRAARGDPEGALALLGEAQRRHLGTPLPEVQPVPAIRARIQLQAGRVSEARAWAEATPIPSETLEYRTEFDHLTLARVHLAGGRGGAPEASLGDTINLLERLADAAESGDRRGSVIEALALLGIARHLTGDRRAAMDPIARALELAQIEGHVRVFVNEGAPMRDLLRQAIARGVSPAYAQRLLSAIERAPGPARGARTDDGTPRLTSREEVVLRLLATGLRNREIAEHLFLSPATVKRHTANIYLKLDVSHRTAALARAADLKLL